VAEIAQHLDDGRAGERLRDGFAIALVGAPNVGKSSLLNRLAGRGAAIVSPQPGTTRDVIEVHLDLAGYPVALLDTAGLRAAGDAIEAEGVRRALARAAEADLVLALFDAAGWPRLDDATAALIDMRTILVLNKIDLASASAGARAGAMAGGASLLPVSAETGEGMEALLAAIRARIEDLASPALAAPVITRERHRQALVACRDALSRALAAGQADLAAEDVRLAVRELGRITGRVDVEDLLDVIFRDFCIGK
jgi:tRNA modification GTPase